MSIRMDIADIKGINPVDCMHYIHLDENTKSTRKMQRQLNPNMKEVIRIEVLKLLYAGITPFLIVHGSVLYKLSPRSQESQ